MPPNIFFSIPSRTYLILIENQIWIISIRILELLKLNVFIDYLTIVSITFLNVDFDRMQIIK